jgi:hypothetical protein
MNDVYKDMVSGMIDSKHFYICQEESCSYTLKIETKGVKTMQIFNIFTPEIEELNYDMEGEYYEKTYDKDTIRYYKLPYMEEVEGLDFSFSLRPSTGETGLYIHPKTKPLNLQDY